MVKGEIGNWSRIQREAGRYRANNRRRPRLTVGNNRQSPRRFQLISPLSSPNSMYDRLRTQLVSASGFVSIKEPTANPLPFPSTHRYRDIIGLLARSLTGVTVIEPPHRCLSLPLTYFPSLLWSSLCLSRSILRPSRYGSKIVFKLEEKGSADRRTHYD